MQTPFSRGRSERTASLIAFTLVAGVTARATTFTRDNAAANLA